MKKRVIIRTDANSQIAGGHIARCLTIADALVQHGVEVEFVLSDGGRANQVRARGHGVVVLDSDWRDLSEKSNVLLSCAAGPDPTAVLIDAYALTRKCADYLSRNVRVCYLGSKREDLGNLALLVNYSTDIDRPWYESTYGPRGTRLLLGPEYAPLKPSFAASYYRRSGDISRVLLTTGSTDQIGFVPKFLRDAVERPSLQRVAFYAVVGNMFDEDEAREIECLGRTFEQVEVCRGISDMTRLVEACDVAVAACGTTVYEMAAAGLPVITFAMVDEQVRDAVSLSALGAVAYAGPYEGSTSVLTHNALALLSEFLNDSHLPGAYADRAHAITDGNGAERIARELSLLLN